MNRMERLRVKLVRYCPPILPVCLVYALISLGMLLYAKGNAPAADMLNHWYGGAVRIIMAYLTQLLPFSAAEFLLLASPLLAGSLIALAVYCGKKGLRAAVRFVALLLSLGLLVFSLFVAGLGLGYYETTLADKLELEDKSVTAEELAETMDWLIDESNALCGDVSFVFDDRSYMPFETLDAMCRDLMIGYARFGQDCPSFYQFSSHVKPVILSVPMSYTHITGIYTFFTGEANLNVDFPDYTLPFTAAHELAHQRGFAREKEANFVAFMVTIKSDNPYTRYSGYVNMLEYVSNALYSADRELWNEEMGKLDRRVRGEMNAYSRFYEKYRESKAAEVSDKLNDTYLKMQGQEAGSKSYGLVVDLTVAYYEKEIKNADAGEP